MSGVIADPAARPLTALFRADGEAPSLAEYERGGGYAALRRLASGEISPDGVIAAVTAANLRGRGGAGFPTGKKWSFLPPPGEGGGRPRHLVCNADEMEPGAFKDRVLLEGNPHLLVEGMIVSAWALHAGRGVVFLRRAYRRAGARLAAAIAEARAAGYLGERILGADFSLDLRVHVSAGRYICGEETALLNALEGRRPVPRSKPPHPQASGLYGDPTVVNNVETLCNVPGIVARGADWYRGLSLCADGGTKIYAVSGTVRTPGAWELPLGTPLRELVERRAGGMAQGRTLRALIPGGASTEFLLPRDLDVAMDFDAVQAAGSRLGTGTVVVLDDRTCPVGMVLSLERFFARESCGWCTPCREGLPWAVRILEALESGAGAADDLGMLEHLAGMMGPGRTFCALAPGAMEPLRSALVHFREDFARHVAERRCPWGRG